LTDLRNAATHWGLASQIDNGGLTITKVKHEIDAGRPVISLCHYGSFGNSLVSFRGGHFVTVIGFTIDHVIIHDPIGWRGARNWLIPNDVFIKAVGIDVALDGNPAFAGIRFS
jgi:hypothetical protein